MNGHGHMTLLDELEYELWRLLLEAEEQLDDEEWTVFLCLVDVYRACAVAHRPAAGEAAA